MQLCQYTHTNLKQLKDRTNFNNLVVTDDDDDVDLLISLLCVGPELKIFAYVCILE